MGGWVRGLSHAPARPLLYYYLSDFRRLPAAASGTYGGPARRNCQSDPGGISVRTFQMVIHQTQEGRR